MKSKAKENLENALNELCACDPHLNNAYSSTKESYYKSEIHNAIKAVGNAVSTAQIALSNYKD